MTDRPDPSDPVTAEPTVREQPTAPETGATTAPTAADGTPAHDAAALATEAAAGDPVLEEFAVAEPEQVAPDPSAAIAALTAAVERLEAKVAQDHRRAEHREAVVDRLQSEADQLRRGERRSLLRPLITEVVRVRDGLLRQAATLPADFDAEGAAALLGSFADDLGQALEDNGVVEYTPEIGDAFDPRSHRVVSKVPTPDAGAVNSVAAVRAPGYRELESGLVLSPARIGLHVAAPVPAADPAPAGPPAVAAEPPTDREEVQA